MRDLTMALPCLIAAPFIGSFAATVGERLPLGRPVLVGRSLCDGCGRTLGPMDLIPVVAWLVLRGRCRTCGAPIGAVCLVAEGLAFAVAVWSGLVFSGWLVVASCGLGWTLLALAVADQRHFRLPDALTLPLMAAGLGVGLATTGPGWEEAVIAHGGGLLAGGGALAAVAQGYRRARGVDGLGFGDVKLAAAAGAWVTWAGLPLVVLIAAAGCLALTATVRLLHGQPVASAEPVPFGPALCAGLWLAWTGGPAGAGWWAGSAGAGP